jgi:hypothetical protein
MPLGRADIAVSARELCGSQHRETCRLGGMPPRVNPIAVRM